MSGIIKKPTKKQEEPDDPGEFVDASDEPVQSNVKKCMSRNTIKLREFAKHIGAKNESILINVLFARALLKSDMLDTFLVPDASHASECVFSYPDSDWYSIYLVDRSTGDKYWDKSENQYRAYFKINIDDPSNPYVIGDTVVYSPPDELLDSDGTEKLNCVVNPSSGRCNNPPKKAVGAVRKPAGTRKGKEPVIVDEPDLPPPSQVSQSVLAQLEQLSLGGGAGPSTTKVTSGTPGGTSGTKGGGSPMTREYFDKLKSKEMIVEWMIKEMKREDLIKCIKKGALSPGDVRDAERIASMEGPVDEFADTGSVSGDDDEVLGYAQSLPPEQVDSMFRKITKEDIKRQISTTNQDERNEKVLLLCKRAGITGYRTKKTSRGLRLVDIELDEQLDSKDVDKLLDQCAQRQAIRMRGRLAALSEVNRLRGGRQEIFDGASGSGASGASGASVTPFDIIDPITRLPREEMITRIVELASINGLPYISVRSKRGEKELRLYEVIDGDNELINDSEINDILLICGETEARRLNQGGSGFGRRRRISRRRKISSKQKKHQLKFKRAVKNCKGKRNFRKCVSKLLKKRK